MSSGSWSRSRSKSPSPPPHTASSSAHYFQRPQYFEPLLNRIDNAWLDEKNLVHDDDDDDDDYHRRYGEDDDTHYPDFCDIDNPTPARLLRRLWIRTLRLRRILSLLLLVYFVTLIIRVVWISPWLAEDRFFRPGLDKKNGAFGVHSPAALADIIQTAEIDSRHLPGGENDTDGKKRLVFVGDIHGCIDEFRDLLEAVAFDPATDHLVHTGDVLAKGPDSPGVIDTLINLNASGVRGNWEDRILTASQSLFAQQRIKSVQQIAADAASHHHEPSKETSILAQLRPHHIKYLSRLPLILSIPPPSPPSRHAPKLPKSLPFFSRGSYHIPSPSPHHSLIRKSLKHPLLLVHAGLVPALPLLRQDPQSIMTMRYIHAQTHLPLPGPHPGCVRWPRVWSWYQRRLKRGIRRPSYASLDPAVDGAVERKWSQGWGWYWKHPPEEQRTREGDWMGAVGLGGLGKGKKGGEEERPTVVVYGHNAREGVVVDDWSVGLDGACVQGGRLAGMVLDAWGRRSVVSVKCKNYRTEGEE
ncbi:Metallo-dependent phosphatase [Myriangium duriaei CBS 260.36]|uniref:Metallo-dependent phosphatase n=1 Tax=Myriangium duriaei CBS 260.36 TaxID=1168546 RepID=A0A9P4J7X4_9PEZI|nr:Metallo-dependent phosphatase [Myriangium duriaei CBS 260.36]